MPAFEPGNSLHRQLSTLSEQAHTASDKRDASRVQEAEAEIDDLATRLWGLKYGELKEIRASLEELS